MLQQQFLRTSEWKEKESLEDDTNEDTVEFSFKNTFIFDEELTLPLTGDEIITMPHMAMIVRKINSLLLHYELNIVYQTLFLLKCIVEMIKVLVHMFGKGVIISVEGRDINKYIYISKFIETQKKVMIIFHKINSKYYLSVKNVSVTWIIG